MAERQYTLVEIIRDRTMLLCEASDLTAEGHYYLYQYNGLEGRFYRATVPSGAVDVHFRALKSTEMVPVGGWRAIGRRRSSKSRLHLVTAEDECSG